MPTDPQAIVDLLGLQPHPEGGFYRETYRSSRTLANDRAVCTAIYYLLTDGNPSRMHRVASDEIWHFYAGDPLEMLQLDDGASRVVKLGQRVIDGEHPQVLVPGGVWQGTRVRTGGSYALVGATVAPGFEFAEFELGDRAELTASYPGHAELIAALTR